MRHPRIAVVEHEEKCPPALFGAWLAESGAELEVVRPYSGDDLPDFADHDAVVVLGGQMSANDDSTVAWLGPLKESIRGQVDSGAPLLGICLGHQLIAVALGGEVRRNPRGQTVGLQPIGWTAEAAADQLFGHVATPDTLGVQWNRDLVLAPPPAMVGLATDPAGDLQVARFGPSAWGIQAHPEVDRTIVERWADSYREEHSALGIDQAGVLDAIDAARSRLDTTWRAVARRFVEIAQEPR